MQACLAFPVLSLGVGRISVGITCESLADLLQPSALWWQGRCPGREMPKGKGPGLVANVGVASVSFSCFCWKLVSLSLPSSDEYWWTSQHQKKQRQDSCLKGQTLQFWIGRKRDRDSRVVVMSQAFSLACQNVIYRHTSIHPVGASSHILCPQIFLVNWIGNMWAASSIKSFFKLGRFPAHFNKSWL